MTDLLNTLGPIFGLLILGFASGRTSWMTPASVRGLVLFAFTFSIPALLIQSMAELVVPDQFDAGFLLSFYGGSAIVYGGGLAVARYGYGRPLADQAIFGLCASFSNLVLMGIPVVLAVQGQSAMLPMMLIIGFHSATFMPLTVVLIQADRSADGASSPALTKVVSEVARNPIIVGILVGLALNVGSVPLPGVVDETLAMLGATAVPCALFALGASLAGMPLGGDAVAALGLAGLKLVVHPLAVWVLAVPVLGLEGQNATVAVLLAAMPTGVNVYLFGARYDAAAEIAARTVLLTTSGSAVTLSLVLAWL
ncbi:MAG: AEC family transporter [Gemmatimonadota bacterium]